MDERWYSTTEAGRILGIHPSTVRELIEEGRLAARVYRYSDAGRPTIRIRASDIDDFIERWTDPDSERPGSPRR
jgi:excisionase family DNA binding protein